MSELYENLNRLIAKTELKLSQQQVKQLVDFVKLMHKWNKAYNLSSVRDPKDMLVKHIMDSIVVAPYIEGNEIADIGTGPGLPGIPLAIMFPEKQFSLVDSLGKRIRFITQACHELGIKNVSAHQIRVENFQSTDGFDCILSRAFASLSDMLSWCEHLVAPTGQFVALKGQLRDSEISEIPANFTVVETVELSVPELDGERHLLKIKKIS